MMKNNAEEQSRGESRALLKTAPWDPWWGSRHPTAPGPASVCDAPAGEGAYSCLRLQLTLISKKRSCSVKLGVFLFLWSLCCQSTPYNYALPMAFLIFFPSLTISCWRKDQSMAFTFKAVVPGTKQGAPVNVFWDEICSNELLLSCFSLLHFCLNFC